MYTANKQMCQIDRIWQACKKCDTVRSRSLENHRYAAGSEVEFLHCPATVNVVRAGAQKRPVRMAAKSDTAHSRCIIFSPFEVQRA